MTTHLRKLNFYATSWAYVETDNWAMIIMFGGQLAQWGNGHSLTRPLNGICCWWADGSAHKFVWDEIHTKSMFLLNVHFHVVVFCYVFTVMVLNLSMLLMCARISSTVDHPTSKHYLLLVTSPFEYLLTCVIPVHLHLNYVFRFCRSLRDFCVVSWITSTYVSAKTMYMSLGPSTQRAQCFWGFDILFRVLMYSQ